MKVLFVHNNFPAQFQNVVEALKEMSGFELAAIGAKGAQVVQGVAVHRYAVPSIDVSATLNAAVAASQSCMISRHLTSRSADGSPGETCFTTSSPITGSSAATAALKTRASRKSVVALTS